MVIIYYIDRKNLSKCLLKTKENTITFAKFRELSEGLDR